MTYKDLENLVNYQQSWQSFQDRQVREIQDELNKWAKEFIASCLGPVKSAELFKAADDKDYDKVKELTDRWKIYWLEFPSKLPYTKVLVCGEHKGTFTFNPRTLP